MPIAGTYPMLYALFEADGSLSCEGVRRQVAAVRAAGAAGVAVLGLGTEAHKLGRGERRAFVDWTLEAAGGLPVAVTVGEGNVPDMTRAAREAEAAGAAWLILQPPRPPASGADLVDFFARVAGAVGLPVAVQDAPEFLGVGLTPDDLAELARREPNVVIVKAEATALAVGDLVDALGGALAVFNGRAGLELTDNWRAGVAGMIPGLETVDLQVAAERAMRAGDEAGAEAAYARVLPTVAFIMQGLAQFVLYGKLIAELRLDLPPGPVRGPSPPLTDRGRAWARRLASALGPLAR